MEIGVLDLKTACVLRTLTEDNPSLEFEVFVYQDLLQGQRPKKTPISILPLCINVCGPMVCSDKVGSALSDVKVFLQEPIYMDPAFKYYNPHFYNFEGTDTPRFLDLSSRSSIDFAGEIDAILEHSGSMSLSASVEQDRRIRTKLHKYGVSCVTLLHCVLT